MMVSGISSSSSTMFSNYRLSSVSTNQNTEQESVQAKGPGGPGGRKGPPPAGGKGKGPEVDTNSDNIWDTEELQSLSDKLSESGATSFSVDELMETYDTDGDGVISEVERQGIQQNNAFNLPRMKDMQQVMMNGSRGLEIQQSSLEDLNSSQSEDQIVQKMIAAYLQQSKYVTSYMNPDLDVTTE